MREEADMYTIAKRHLESVATLDMSLRTNELVVVLFQIEEEAFAAGKVAGYRDGLIKSVEIAQRIYPTEDDFETALLTELDRAGGEG